MSQFSTIYTDLLDYMHRPSSELLTQAKREVNNAILWLQRRHGYKMTERLIRVAYPANTLFINLTEACEGQVRTVLNVQQVASAESLVGHDLEIRSYEYVLKEKREFQRKHVDADPDYSGVDPFPAYGDYINRTHRHILFLLGDNNIGLFPTPTQEIHLMIHLNIWLPQLVADEDTNFFLTYAYDVVLQRALMTSQLYMKEDRRLRALTEDFQSAYDALLLWDSQVRGPLNG